MAPTIKSLGLDQLPVEHKLELVEELWDHIATHPESLPMPSAHWEELQRRLAQPEGEAAQTWDEVKREIESEL